MKLLAKNIRGLYSRGSPDSCPPNFLNEARNFISSAQNLVPRPAFIQIAPAKTKSSVNHLSLFEPAPIAGVVSPKLIAHRFTGTSQVFNLDDFPGASIYVGNTTYHSWANFFGRGYFTLHDTVAASATEKVQVYEGGAASRNALGAKPVSAMVGAAAVGGNLGVGKYLFDVVYVTSSGFITKPSGSIVAVDCFGSYKVNLTVIPTGPAGTAQRRIIMTKAISLGTYTGNPLDYEFFFAPGGTINDNVTTILTISEFDGNLISSADYLFDNLESLTSGLGIGEYNNRMIVWGEAGNPSIIRVSKPGEPESFSSTSGFIIVDPSESGGVNNCISLRNNLYIFKNSRIFVTTDNGDEASTWPVTLFDAGVGTGPYGITKIYDSKGVHINQFMIASRSGLILFDGLIRFPELTTNIDDLWGTIDPNSFSKIETTIDPINKGIYILITKIGGDKIIIYGDYSEGITYEAIKWFTWEPETQFVGAISSILIEFDPANQYTTVYCAAIGAIVEFDPANPQNQDDFGSGIASFNCILQSSVIELDGTQDISQLNMVEVRQKGAGLGEITAQGISAADSTIVSPVYTLPFITAPTKYQDKWCYLPFVDNQPTIKIIAASTNRPRISRIKVDADVYGESGPQ